MPLFLPPSSFPPDYKQEQFLCLEMFGILSSLREAISKPQPQMLIEREWALLRKWYKPGGQPSNRPTALSFSTLRSSLSLSFSLPAAVRPPRVASSFRPSFSERFSLRRRGRWMDLQSPRLSQLLALSLSPLRDCPEPSEIAHGMCRQECIYSNELRGGESRLQKAVGRQISECEK